MIVVDEPMRYPAVVGGKPNPIPNAKWSHLLSDLPSIEGRHELIAFARKIGLRPSWIQKAGTEYEHFDVTLSKRRKAVKMGAVEITQREMVAIIKAKREARREHEGTEEA